MFLSVKIIPTQTVSNPMPFKWGWPCPVWPSKEKVWAALKRTLIFNQRDASWVEETFLIGGGEFLADESKKGNHEKVVPCWPFCKLHDAWHFCLFRSPCDIFLVGLFSINPEVGHLRVFCSLPEEMRSPNDCNPASGKCLSLPLVTIVNTHTKTNTSRTGRKRLCSLRTKELYNTPTQLLLKGSPSRGDILMISPARGRWVGEYKYRKFLTPPTPGIAATH